MLNSIYKIIIIEFIKRYNERFKDTYCYKLLKRIFKAQYKNDNRLIFAHREFRGWLDWVRSMSDDAYFYIYGYDSIHNCQFWAS